MKDYTFNGKCYAVNLNDSAISDVSVIYYNKKALQDAEMEDPYQIWKKNPKAWTWEKFWSMCEQFVNANKNRVIPAQPLSTVIRMSVQWAAI